MKFFVCLFIQSVCLSINISFVRSCYVYRKHLHLIDMVVHDRMLLRKKISYYEFLFLGDISRFADRSRELWSERTMSEMKYKENSSLICFLPFFKIKYDYIGFLRCCGSCPFASLLAFILTLTGTAIFCGCLYYPIRASIEQINNVFQIEYIDYEWYELKLN